MLESRLFPGAGLDNHRGATIFSIMIRAQVIVRPRSSIFDPQGDAVCRAIQQLGLSSVRQAHVGKCIELELEDQDLDQARAKLEPICKDLLSNPVIEDYVLTFPGSGTSRAATDEASDVDS